jgi:hypothetical protein
MIRQKCLDLVANTFHESWLYVNLKSNQKLLVTFGAWDARTHIPVTNDDLETHFMEYHSPKRADPFILFLYGLVKTSVILLILSSGNYLIRTPHSLRHYRFGFTGIQIVGDDIFAGTSERHLSTGCTKPSACKGFITESVDELCVSVRGGFENGTDLCDAFQLIPLCDGYYEGNIIEAFSVDNRLPKLKMLI